MHDSPAKVDGMTLINERNRKFNMERDNVTVEVSKKDFWDCFTVPFGKDDEGMQGVYDFLYDEFGISQKERIYRA